LPKKKGLISLLSGFKEELIVRLENPAGASCRMREFQEPIKSKVGNFQRFKVDPRAPPKFLYLELAVQ
jgi:hypothetical protein